MISLDIAGALGRIRPYLAPTPLLASSLPVGGAGGARHAPPRCWLKCENL